MPTITVTPNTNIVLVNTASGDQTTVNLPPVTPGQLITIRDNVGAASSNNQITITTTGGSVFSTGTVLPDGNSNIKISQPFGAVTVGYSGGYKWNILNTFAFENPTFAKVDAVTVSSITFRDSIGNGSNYLLNVNNNILYRDGIKIIEGPEFNSGIARHNGGVSSLSSIVSYGLSSLVGAAQPHYGLSSLSSIVSYGLSSLVGAGGSTPSNWAAYPALEDVNFGGYNITNVGDIDLTNDGVKRSIKCSEIKIGNPVNSFSINEKTDIPGPYLQLNGNTYINGSLTIPIGKELIVYGSLYLGIDQISYSGGVLSVGGNEIGGNASTWSQNDATQNVNIAGCNIIYVNSLEFGTSPNIMSLTKSVDNDNNDCILVDGIIRFNDQSEALAIDFSGRSIINAGNVTIRGDVTINGEDSPNGLNITAPLNVSSNTTLADTTINGTLILNNASFTTLVNPVGAYIELSIDSPSSTGTYPLYIGTHNITTFGALGIRWWRTIFDRFSGIILLPGYDINITNGTPGNDFGGFGYINIGVSPQYNALTVNYSSNIIYTLTYNPT